MLLKDIVELLPIYEDTGTTPSTDDTEATEAINAARARADAMRHGARPHQSPSQVKAIGAKRKSKTNAPRASQQDELTANTVLELVTQAYTDVRIHKNYNVTSIAIKVGGVSIRDKVSNSVRMLNATLRSEYGIEPVKIGNNTIIYHIPYEI